MELDSGILSLCISLNRMNDTTSTNYHIIMVVNLLNTIMTTASADLIMRNYDENPQYETLKLHHWVTIRKHFYDDIGFYNGNGPIPNC